MLADAIKLLRNDALDRGMKDLAICYGWTLIRLEQERVDHVLREIQQNRLARGLN